jgi:urease accessory protein
MSQQRLTADPNGDEERSGEPIASPVGSEKLSAFLGSLQLGDSFFPSGLYTLSHGLEAFAQADELGPATLEALLVDHLRDGFGAADAVALACAHRAIEEHDLDLAALADVRLTATKLPREARETSLRAGRQLLHIAGEIFGGEVLDVYAEYVRGNRAPGNHAVVLGLVMATQGIPREMAIAGELYALVSSCVAAAVRLALVDHVVAQVALHRLKPVIAEVARANRDKEVQDIASCVPRIDVMAMRHERAEVRLFMS